MRRVDGVCADAIAATVTSLSQSRRTPGARPMSQRLELSSTAASTPAAPGTISFLKRFGLGAATSSTLVCWLSNLRRHGLGRRASGPALNAELSLISSAKTHTARRHAKGMICVGGQCVLAAYRITVAASELA